MAKTPYNTRMRKILAIKRHLIGMGAPGVGSMGSGNNRDVTIEGWNARTVANLHHRFNVKGRRVVIDQWTDGDPRPWVAFEVPGKAEDPEEILVTMSLTSFAILLRKVASP